jgi:hypothetical protein
LLDTCRRSLLHESIQKTQFARQQSQPVDKNQAAYGEQKYAAANLDGVQVAAETLIETQELINAHGR